MPHCDWRTVFMAHMVGWLVRLQRAGTTQNERREVFAYCEKTACKKVVASGLIAAETYEKDA